LRRSYDPITGEGAVGVEFAGTAVTSGSSFGSVTAEEADEISAQLVATNVDLQWSEGFYRGFFTLTITADHLNASYYAMQNISKLAGNSWHQPEGLTELTGNFNLDAFNSATFTVNAGENKLARPVAGGEVLAGALKSNSTSS
jgi:alkaline phosphatase D